MPRATSGCLPNSEELSAAAEAAIHILSMPRQSACVIATRGHIGVIINACTCAFSDDHRARAALSNDRVFFVFFFSVFLSVAFPQMERQTEKKKKLITNERARACFEFRSARQKQRAAAKYTRYLERRRQTRALKH